MIPTRSKKKYFYVSIVSLRFMTQLKFTNILDGVARGHFCFAYIEASVQHSNVVCLMCIDDPKEHKKSKFSLRRKKSKSEGKVQEATEKTFAKDYQESTSAHDLEGESTKLLAVDQQKDHPATGEKRFSRQIVHSKRENSVTMHTEKSATKTNIELIFDESIHTEYNETALKKEKSENIGKEFKSTKKG